MKKYYLMAPGPTPVPPGVLLAMAQPMIHHRTPEYEALFIEVRAGLKRLFQTAGDVIPFTSSGTGAMEAAVANTLSAGDAVVLLRAGKFAERWEEICQAFGVRVIAVSAPFGETVPAERIADALRQHPEARAVLMQHSESSTGVLHDVKGIAAAVAADRRHPDRRRGVEPRHRRSADGRVGRRRGRVGLAEGVDAAARALLLRRVREGVGAREGVAAAEVLLRPGRRATGPSPRTRRTSPRRCRSSSDSARCCGCSRRKAWPTRSSATSDSPARHGPAPRPSASSCSPGRRRAQRLTAVVAPRGVDSERVLSDYSTSHNITIAGGQGEMKGRVFRLGHMGYVAEFDVLTSLAALEQVLHGLGQPVDFGAAVRAAQKIFVDHS